MIRTQSMRGATRPGRLMAGVALLASGVALLVTPVGAGGQVTANAAASNITITQTPAADQTAPCMPSLLALSQATISDATTFKLIVTASAPLCEPVTAGAVVYAMPGNGEAWPQNLVERTDFTITGAGVTEITFTKTCAAVQFDVINGVSPAVIFPGGPAHDPLLFPLDVGTSLQFWGLPDCVAATTTVAPTTAAPTTTAFVLAATTVAAPTTTIPSVVLGATTVPVGSAGLAVTGSSSDSFALVGGGLVVLGLAFMMGARRKLA